MTRFALLTSIAALAFSASSIGCEEQKPEPPPRLRAVRYVKVAPSGGLRTIRVNGKSAAGTESILSFRVSGTVARLHVKVGQDVKKKQLLAELDGSDYQLQLQQAVASLASVRAQYRNASKQYERMRSLWVSGHAKEVDVESARTQKDVAGAQAAAAAKNAQLARRRVTYTKLFSPVDGKVARTMVTDNQSVRAGLPVVVLTSGDKAKVHTSLPTKYINDVKDGDLVKVKFDEIPGKTFEAEVSEVGVTSTQSSTFMVIAVLKKSADEIRPDYNADVEFSIGSRDDHIRFFVFTTAVNEDLDGRYVYLLEKTDKEQGVVSRKNVTLGEITTDGIEVLTGIKEGDLLVTAGIHRLHEGMKVRVLERWRETK